MGCVYNLCTLYMYLLYVVYLHYIMWCIDKSISRESFVIELIIFISDMISILLLSSRLEWNA